MTVYDRGRVEDPVEGEGFVAGKSQKL